MITPPTMPPLTVCKSRGKANVEENTPKASKSSKRVSSAKNVTTKGPPKQKKGDMTNAATDDEDSEEKHPYVPPVKDISEETYTLQKMVMLGAIPIVSDTDFLKLNEFNFQDFTTMNIRKADKYAKKGGFGFDTGPCTATISAKGIRVMDNINITVDDFLNWKKVEQGIKRWMLAGKKEIIVKLTVMYSKVAQSNSEESEDDRPLKKKVSAFVFVLI